MGGRKPVPGISRPERVSDEGLRRLEQQLQSGAKMSRAVREQWIRRYGDAARALFEKYP